ncbi:endonuclease/exonuclease/phosphatase family protein [Pedobacter sp.]
MKKSAFFLFLVLLLAFASSKAQQPPNTLKVLDYNSLHGFNGDSLIRAKYISWVKTVAPDVVMYQEMIGFSKAELKTFAKKYGHSFSVIMSKETGYDVTHPIAITSKYPIDKVEMHNDKMWHGYVYAQIKNVHFIATHLAPFTLKDRQQDIELILNKIKAFPKNAEVLVGGDFNSFARFDSANYDEKLLNSMLRLEGRLEPKSGTPIVKNRTIYRNNLNNGAIDFSVTDKMIDAGFADAYFFLHKSFKNSVPVKSQMKKNSILRRVDYIWVNKPLAKKLVYADIIQDSITHFISDHYPTVATFKLN